MEVDQAQGQLLSIRLFADSVWSNVALQDWVVLPDSLQWPVPSLLNSYIADTLLYEPRRNRIPRE